MNLVNRSIQASGALHLIAVAAVAAWTALPTTTPPRHAGSSQAIELVVTKIDPTWSEQSVTFDQTKVIEPPVTVQPTVVTIAQKQFALATTNSLMSDSISVEVPFDPQLTTLSSTRQPDRSVSVNRVPELLTQEIALPRHQTPPPKIQPAPAQTPQKFSTDETAPSFTSSPPPNYPSIAITNRWEGTTLLRVLIDETGAVTKVEVARSSGYAILDGAAVNAVQRWHGAPATRFGKPVETTELLPVRFRL